MNIIIRNLSKKFEPGFAIRDFSLTIDDKSFVTFLGPSGCGKTTVLRMIAGLETPDSGEIYFDDTCVYSSVKKINVLPEKRDLGFVFQDFALWPHMTVFENVAFSLRSRKNTSDLKKKVMAVLEAVKLADLSERYPNQLSGGQQQRVAFARSMAGNPGCILFDEPLSALDAILREEMRVEIRKLVTELGVTAVFVTHDQLEAMSMSDRIVVMNKGKIEQDDEPEALYYAPKVPFVAKFIGKSNWLNEYQMFRPEKASLEPMEGADMLEAEVEGVQFIGNSYELRLKYKKEKWVYQTPRRHNFGDVLSVYIKRENIIKVHYKEEMEL